MKKSIKRILKLLLAGLLICFIIFIWLSLPIVTGYRAKTLCSGVFISSRNPSDIAEDELGSFPLSIGSYFVDMKDSSVTASVFGLAKRKAIFRKGLGATLIVGISENELREQVINIASAAFINQDTIDWPRGNRVNTISPEIPGKRQLDKVINQEFERVNKNSRTRAIVIVYNDQIIAEKYATGYSANTKQAGLSMAKSIMNALIGILVKQGKLKIDSPAPVSQWKNDERKAITITNLMQMNSGLKWSEFPFGPSGFTNMLFKKGDMAEFALSPPLRTIPGRTFNYSSGSPVILSRIIRDVIGDSDYYRFPYEQLFLRIGMLNTILEVDPGGTFVGSNYCYATARDWARFGLLYLKDGIWNGERLLPEGWIKFTTTSSGTKTNSNRGEYGALWWLNITKTYPNVPADCFSCQGYGGQYVWVIPSKKLVVVRLALDHGVGFDPNVFLFDVINALPKSKPSGL